MSRPYEFVGADGHGFHFWHFRLPPSVRIRFKPRRPKPKKAEELGFRTSGTYYMKLAQRLSGVLKS